MAGASQAVLLGAAFAQVSPALISLWSFDETAGMSFADNGPANVPMDIVGTWADLSTGSLVQGIGGTSAYTNGSGHATIPANDPGHDLSELTISFYYQRNSAAAKNILLAGGDGTQPGDFSIEVLANGRLRGYHVGQDGMLRFFQSSSGVTGTDLQVGTAHRIDVSFGPQGAKIYLDGSELAAAIPQNTNGWNNARVKYLGRWTDGVQSPSVGVFDRVRLWDRQLSAAEIAALEPAQSITLPFVDVGVLQAFTRSTIDVTALSGWPAGRTPKAILQQGPRCSGYIRRAWKPSNNNGNFIDFIPGWQRTTATEVIRLELDNDTSIDLAYTVAHTIPSGGGVARTLDQSGGGDFTNWPAAVAALTSGDVLIVRAPTGTWNDPDGHPIPNYVYDVSADSPTPPVGVVDVTVITHPDDVAAGRRPILWRNADRYARFKYDAANSWQVHAALGGSHGTVYQSAETSAQPAHSYFGAYRDQLGDWIGMYCYQAITDGTDRSPIMHDTTYAQTTMVTNNQNTYFGPGVLYNKSTSRWEVRLSPPPLPTFRNPSATSIPYPPWDWTAHYAPDNDARNCEIVITDGGTFGGGNTLLDITSRNGWKFYNIDFVYGNFAVTANQCSTQPQFFGCTFLGGTPSEFNNNGADISRTSSAIIRDNTTVVPATDLLLDRCSIHGAMMPWTSFGEGKGFRGAFGLAARRDFLSWSNAKVVFRFCNIRHWWQFWWHGNGANPQKAHFHHSKMYQFGMDGALLGENTNDADAFNVNRCFMPSAHMYGFTTADNGSARRWMTFCVDLRLSTLINGFPNRHKWGYVNAPDNIAAFVHSQSVAHASGARSNHQERKFHNTFVGSQNTMGVDLYDSGEGCGSGMGPDSRGTNHRIFNNIAAVYPPPTAWPIGKSSLVTLYTREGGNSQYNNNVLFKSAGMLSPGTGSNTFCKVNSGSGSGTAYSSLSALQSGEGFEANSVQADPQFVVAPAWASRNPYAAGGAFDMANYMLGQSSPARAGARNLNDQSVQDYDFETLTTLAAGTNLPFGGALDPNIPFIEQEVGIVGPLPPEIG